MSSPYYKGLINTEKVCVANSEAQNTTPTAYSSPYYKGLINTERVRVANSEAENTTPTAYSSPYYKGLVDHALLPIPNRESQSTTISSSSSKTSFSDKIQQWSADCFKFSTPLSPHIRPSSPPSSAKRAVINTKESREPVEGKKYSWADKYRPADLENFISKKDKTIALKQKKSDESCPAFISEGVTKPRTICELICEAFGPDKVQFTLSASDRFVSWFRPPICKSWHLDNVTVTMDTSISLQGTETLRAQKVTKLITVTDAVMPMLSAGTGQA